MPGTVLITGAAGGIGRATALLLARRGWHCVLVDADAAALDRLQAEWPADAPAPLALVADLTDAARIEALGALLPPLDALINNAGMSAGGAEVLAGHDDGAAQRLLALNLEAPARMVRVCTPHLRVGARIVNVASGAGLRAIPWRGLYSASKAGVIAQTQALARARPDWSVSALSPGFVRTELVQRLIDSRRLDLPQVLSRIPLARMAEPEDMAEALAFLVSPGARPCAGQLLVLDGGSSVYGGSQPLPPTPLPALAFDMPRALQCASIESTDWQAALAQLPTASTGYPAVIDGRALQAPVGGVLAAVLDAARAFRSSHARQASLTLLLPPAPAHADWSLAGDAAAARMALATLAAEWGAPGLRINALSASCAPAECVPLLDYMSGARAQFLTGQVLMPALP
ncbi:SDR family oxidoreductase [Acidovorax sp. CCYZU-2555]|uniref:SDR family NAD(P)-dependent oxidoreductase n=1 Tax=Acidovorax sp. CCYZU-2555 TaxID=2835042 RepID=UPI001BCE2034|nr:SDR family oxidoreductase [Acidovorax sp. CCYZU-2555]MBS7780968.1 SDR family oxidoreductase [Acidovorax sp. CCYZU-2555]